MEKLIILSAVRKIKRLTRPEFDKLSKSEKMLYLDEYPESTFKETGPSIKNIKLDIQTELTALSKHLNVSSRDIQVAVLQRDVKAVLSHGISALADATTSVLSFANNIALSTFEELAKTATIKKLQSGVITVDRFLDKHPVLKKMTGPLVAGALCYQWMNMAFSGDFDDDFDVSSIGSAMAGEYSVHDLLSSPSGLKSMAQLAIGVVSGGVASFPWSAKLNIGFAAVYTGAKKLKSSNVLRSLRSVQDNFRKKALRQTNQLL